jgi:glutathione S-transferase
MFFEQYSHEPPIANRARGAHALAVMEEHLAAHSWFSVPAYGIADIALYAYTHVAEEGQFSLAGLPAVHAWRERVAARPGHITLMQETSAEPVRTLQNEQSA